MLGRKHRCGVETLRTDTHAEVLTDKQDIAEKFGDYFSTVVGMTDTGNCAYDENNVCRLMKTCDSRFRFNLIEDADVLKLLMALDPNKAIGADKIGGKLLHMTAC